MSATLDAPREAESIVTTATAKERCNDSRQQQEAEQQRSTAEPRDEGNGNDDRRRKWRMQRYSTAKTKTISNSKRKIRLSFKTNTWILPRHRICRRKRILSKLSPQLPSAEPPVSVWTKISKSIMLADFGSLLTKILFSSGRTEIYGILIDMKIPTERSLCWGLRASKTVNLWNVLEALGFWLSYGELHSLYSPLRENRIDICFEMIDVAPSEMKDDEFRTAVAWPIANAKSAERLSLKWRMTVVSIWQMTFVSAGQQFLWDRRS